MVGFKCEKCHYESINKTTFCPNCGERNLFEMNVSDEGEIYSYTTIHFGPLEFVEYAPYQVALVQLTENLKVTGFLTEPVEIGQKVKLKEVKEKAFIFEAI